MITYLYDGGFEGFLSVVFEAYQQKRIPENICSESVHCPSLIEEVYISQTMATHASRVWKGIQEKVSKQAADQIYEVFLSEAKGVEMLLFRYIQLLLQQGDRIRNNYANPDVLKVKQIHKQIGREVHRMHAFVRFKKNIKGLYYSTVDPDFNVLPLIGEHFEKRYADQHWMIFDTHRNYGILFDQKEMRFVEWSETPRQQEFPGEEAYEKLWKNYFDSVNITERKNTKLHLRHVPKRYWKYLPEKSNS